MSAERENKEKPEETDVNELVKSPRSSFFGMPGWFHIAQLQDRWHLRSDLKLPEKPAVKQEDPLGCAVACVAYALNKSYQESLALFANGKEKANVTGFLCKEIVLA